MYVPRKGLAQQLGIQTYGICTKHLSGEAAYPAAVEQW